MTRGWRKRLSRSCEVSVGLVVVIAMALSVMTIHSAAAQTDGGQAVATATPDPGDQTGGSAPEHGVPIPPADSTEEATAPSENTAPPADVTSPPETTSDDGAAQDTDQPAVGVGAAPVRVQPSSQPALTLPRTGSNPGADKGERTNLTGLVILTGLGLAMAACHRRWLR